jgi:uncharacterized protein (TIGR02265 family)
VLPEPPPGFAVPSFTAPLDLEAHLALVPAHATVKGTIAQATVDALVSAGKPAPAEKFTPFRDYPMRSLIELNYRSAQTIYPDVPVREGLRRLGKVVFPAFTQTLLGKVMYGVFGNNVASIFKIANKSYDMTQNVGRCRTEVVGGNAVRISFVDTYTFLSSYHFGIIEGTLEACRVTGAVWLHERTASEGDFHIAWEPRG